MVRGSMKPILIYVGCCAVVTLVTLLLIRWAVRRGFEAEEKRNAEHMREMDRRE